MTARRRSGQGSRRAAGTDASPLSGEPAGLLEIPVYLAAPEALAAKARWVLETLLAAVCERPRFVTDAAAAPSCVLAYSAEPIPGVPTIPQSAEAAALIAERRPLPPQSFQAHRDGLIGAFPTAADGFAVPFDLVASAFMLLACWDELTVADRDRHGRLPFSASLFVTNDALRLDDPACDSYAAWLADALEARCAELGLPGPRVGCWATAGQEVSGGPRFLVALTHDVDQLRRWTVRGWVAWARRLGLDLAHGHWTRARFEAGAALHYLRHDLPQGKDPAFTFGELVAGEDNLGVSSTFYIIASHQHRTDGNQRGAYSRRRPELLRLLATAGREVGLHGNHRDSLDGRALAVDRTSLAAAVADAQAVAPGDGHTLPAGAVSGIRYHYLKCLYHTSLPLVDAAGFAYDSSLSFAEQEGFRCGLSHPFNPYDIENDRPLGIVELPLAVMDSTLQERHYRHLLADQARAATLAVLQRVRLSGGCAALLWHHNRFDPYVGRGYGDAYWEIVRWVTENGGQCVPAHTAVALWKQRGGSAAEEAAAAPKSAAGASATTTGATQRVAAGATPTADRARAVHVSVVHRPDDPRIFERECRSLADAGLDVTYLVPGAGSAFENGVHLANLPRRSRRTRWLSFWSIMTELHRLQPDVVHIHDPELLTLFPALRQLVPCLVYDMHEYVSQAVESKYYIPARVRPAAAKATVRSQRSLVALADGVVAVVDEQLEQLGQRPSLRVTLPNYPRFARFRDATPLPAAIDRSAVPGVAGRLKLIYIGSLTRNRGVDLMLDVLRQVPEVELYLGGTFSNPELETEVAAAADRDLRGRLHLLGRVPPADVPGWLACADVAWVPARKTTQYARPTVATKLFEGMAAGLAVLVSDLPGRGEVVRTEECGLVVEPTVQGHLEGVRRLVADGASVQAMGERARAAVEARYSWEVIESRLVDFYAELLARCRGTRR